MQRSLGDDVREELGLGLVSASQARELTKLPVGNQVETLVAARRAGLSGTDLRCVVDLILAAKTREQVEFVLSKPRLLRRCVSANPGFASQATTCHRFAIQFVPTRC